MRRRVETNADLKKVAVRAGACEQSVLRRLAGLYVRGPASKRVDAALMALGYEPPFHAQIEMFAEEPKKRRMFKVGDKVRVIDDPQYAGFVGTVEARSLGKRWYVGFGEGYATGLFEGEELALAVEPSLTTSDVPFDPGCPCGTEGCPTGPECFRGSDHP